MDLAPRRSPSACAEKVVKIDPRSGLIEAFAVGTVITPLVNPDEAAGGAPDSRVSMVVSTATGVKCEVESYTLKY